MKKRVLITAGGTGGHIYPAIALAQELKPHAEILFVGGGLSSNRYFSRQEFPYKEVSCGLFSLKKPIKSLTGVFSIGRGIFQSRKLMDSFNPNVIVGFGSYYTLPILLAAKSKAIPMILHEANRIPGRVNRLLSKHAALTGVHFPDTALLLTGNTLEIPIPLRKGFKKGMVSKEHARAHFGLLPDQTTLLIFGGSQGAQSINNLASKALLNLSQPYRKRLQVLHFTGDNIHAAQLQESYHKAGITAHVKGFESQMEIAWSAADFMISRAGAGTVAEQLEFEVPGILIPFPQAMDNHQEKNADYMVDIIKGATKHLERDLNPLKLSEEIVSFIEEHEEKLISLRQAMQNHKSVAPKCQLSSVILKMIGESQ